MVTIFKMTKIIFLLALVVFIFTSAFNYYFYDQKPHIHDEIAYLFQAHLFKMGRLFVPSPCGAEFFDFPHLINNGRWYSMYPPGFPALLTLGLIFGAPWIINPILVALSIFVFYFLGRQIYDSLTGFISAILGTISIWLLLMSATFMSHTASMFFCSVFLLFLFNDRKTSVFMQNLRYDHLSLGSLIIFKQCNHQP